MRDEGHVFKGSAAAAPCKAKGSVDLHLLMSVQVHIASFCALPTLAALMLCSHAWNRGVVAFLTNTRSLYLEGALSNREALVQLLSRASLYLEKLDLRVSVRNDAHHEEREWLMAFGEEDQRASTFDLPIGILPRFKNLREMRCYSSNTLIAGVKPWASIQVPKSLIPISLSLSNLWELARSAPVLTVLAVIHVEKDSQGCVTDVFVRKATTPRFHA